MALSPNQLAISFFGILLVFYFGFNTTAPDLHQASEVRSKTLKVTGLENIEKEVLPSLKASQKAELDLLSKIKNSAVNEPEKLESYKGISGFWYQIGQFSLAGAYAKKVAEIEKTEEAWQIAGTTFLNGLDGKTELKKQQFCQQEAIFCLEQAVSLNTLEPSHQLNLALAYVKLPGDDPMKGIKMMLSLENKFPDYLALQLQLAELGIQTGQFEKAKARLDKIILKEPKNQIANCLMVQILEALKETKEINKYQLNCK